jgi:hypothetical protein
MTGAGITETGLREIALTILVAGARMNTLESDTMFDGVGALVPLPLGDPYRN